MEALSKRMHQEYWISLKHQYTLHAFIVIEDSANIMYVQNHPNVISLPHIKYKLVENWIYAI
jgi:hypothetical protein